MVRTACRRHRHLARNKSLLDWTGAGGDAELTQSQCLHEALVPPMRTKDHPDEPLFHHAYHGHVWEQILEEWGAKVLVVLELPGWPARLGWPHTRLASGCFLGGTLTHGSSSQNLEALQTWVNSCQSIIEATPCDCKAHCFQGNGVVHVRLWRSWHPSDSEREAHSNVDY